MRNGIPRDFTLLRYFLRPGCEVFISKSDVRYSAKFVGDKFITQCGQSFTSPYAFARYVVKKDGGSGIPNGWAVIETVDNGRLTNISELYDKGVYRLI